MSNRTKALVHLRSNAVAYVALFFSIGSGTALAANTVFSTDIVDGEVKSVDIGNGEVKTADIGGGEVKTADMANDSVTGAKIEDDSIGNVDLKAGSVRTSEVANESLTGQDIVDGSIQPIDTNGLARSGEVLWAVVDADGTVNRSSTGVASVTPEGSGDYEVFFGGGFMDGCASMAQISRSEFDDPDGVGPGEAATTQGETTGSAIDVRTYDSTGTPTDKPFTVYVLCTFSGSPSMAAKSNR